MNIEQGTSNVEMMNEPSIIIHHSLFGVQYSSQYEGIIYRVTLTLRTSTLQRPNFTASLLVFTYQ
jgi:hypothetical protein